jgi:hypothetical protein
MKSLFALVLLMPLSSFASSLGICSLEVDHYSTNSRYEYVFQNSEVLQVAQQHHNGEVVYLSGAHYPVSFEVTVRAYRDISGTLSVKVDQPGERAYGKVSEGEVLNLSVEDSFNGGKDVYRLSCQTL